MKTFLILILSLIVLSAAFLTRPTEASFRIMAKTEMTRSAGGLLDKIVLDDKIDGFLKECTFKDRVLWTEVERNGQRQYVGLFSHWVEMENGRPVGARPAMPIDEAKSPGLLAMAQ
jgi:hypothetical protein